MRSYPKQKKNAIYYYCQFNNIAKIKWSFNTLLKEEEGKIRVWGWKLIHLCKKILPYSFFSLDVFYPLAYLSSIVPLIHSSLHLYLTILVSIWAFLFRNTRRDLRKHIFAEIFAYYFIMNSQLWGKIGDQYRELYSLEGNEIQDYLS